ncbi:exonuclease domain-containing protein [Streptomyces sp. NPDC004008]
MTQSIDLPWNSGPLASFDIESTGLDVSEDRIVSAALITPSGRRITWLADPGVEIPEAASGVHGITTAYARAHGRPAKETVEDVAATLATALTDAGAALVVMNAPYDLSLLDAECARHGVPTVAARIGRPVGPVIDPLVLDRAADRYRKGRRNLEALAEHYAVVLTNAHTADADAQAALDVALAIAERHAELRVPASVLHGWQVQWHTRWAANFEAHLRATSNPDAVIDGSWPLIPNQRGGAE